ncbi:hypothetical protein ALC53_05291 [Atta colombica]|uniref:Uncharacterized protein n=1 Tax=Atta colombica TaxID=520822 RepID=A0A195BI53_9HYME|nr:hypothetical protein ALC53_05291 [Atta colombica]
MMTVTTAGVKVQDTMAFYPFEPHAKGSRRRALEPAERTNHAAHSSYHGRTILSSRVEFNAYRLQGRRVCCIRASRCWRLDNGVAARMTTTTYDIRAADGASHFTPGPAGIRCRGETKKEVGTM